MNSTGFSKGDILVPDVEDFTAWSVIACDQYTSQPQYWHEVETLVKTKPSTLNMIVPEINLNSEDLDQHIAAVNRARLHLYPPYLEQRQGSSWSDWCGRSGTI